MKKRGYILILSAVLLMMASCARQKYSSSYSRYASRSSVCSSFRYVEKSDNYNRFRTEIKEIVCLDPNYYFRNTRAASYLYNDYTRQQTELVRKASVKAFTKTQLKCKYLFPNMGDSLADLISIYRLKAELKDILFDFQSENVNKNKQCKRSVTRMIATDINLSAEYAYLADLFHCKYFYYTYAEEINHSLVVVSILADLSQGKVVYMDCRKKQRRAGAAHIRNMLSGSVYNMLGK